MLQGIFYKLLNEGREGGGVINCPEGAVVGMKPFHH